MKKMNLFLIVIFSFFSITSLASSLLTLGDIPARHFTVQDAQMQKAAQIDALNNKADGKKLSWKNAATGANGWVMPTHTTQKNGLRCRTLTIHNFAKGRVGQSIFEFCKINNTWKIAN